MEGRPQEEVTLYLGLQRDEVTTMGEVTGRGWGGRLPRFVEEGGC